MTSKTSLPTTTSIVFFGTGEVSLRTLEGISEQVKVEAVVTKPDLHGSNGRTLSPAVKRWADEHGVDCYQPASKAELSELFSNSPFTSKVGLVVDYGIIIPIDVISYFERGILNSHFSLLPKWRGADPITWSILAGDKTTGVSIMELDAGMDTGDILANAIYTLTSDETTDSLTVKLISISNKLLLTTLPKYLSGELTSKPQDDARATYSKKISKEDGLLRPDTYTAAELERQIRAYLGWPGSYITVSGVLLTVKVAQVNTTTIPVGSLVHREHKLLLGCKNGSLEITQIQPAGKKTMDATSFINGYGKLLN